MQLQAACPLFVEPFPNENSKGNTGEGLHLWPHLLRPQPRIFFTEPDATTVSAAIYGRDRFYPSKLTFLSATEE